MWVETCFAHLIFSSETINEKQQEKKKRLLYLVLNATYSKLLHFECNIVVKNLGMTALLYS